MSIPREFGRVVTRVETTPSPRATVATAQRDHLGFASLAWQPSYSLWRVTVTNSSVPDEAIIVKRVREDRKRYRPSRPRPLLQHHIPLGHILDHHDPIFTRNHPPIRVPLRHLFAC